MQATAKSNKVFSNVTQLTIAACDSSNALQQWDVENPKGAGRIRDKATGRCLSIKKCEKPH